MSCDGDTLTLLSCIRRVCAAASAHAFDIGRLRDAAQALEAALAASQSRLACVLEGDASTSCGGLPSLAAAIDALNADSIASIATDTATAAASQTTWTMAAAPASIQHLDVAVNGAHLQPSADYTLSGDTVTFTSALEAGDALAAWRYSL